MASQAEALILVSLHLLIVDDEFTIAAALAELVEMEGHTATTCGDGEDAWELLRTGATKFDLIVTDQMMPRMDGTELLALVRATPKLKRIPALLISALPEPRIVPKTWQAYLTKPFDIDHFLAVLRKLGASAARKDTRH